LIFEIVIKRFIFLKDVPFALCASELILTASYNA